MERVASTRITNTICMVTRVSQVVLCAVVLACAAYGISGMGSLDPLNFAVFASITGMATSLLMLLGTRFNPVLAANLPGLVDVILSGVWCIFFLAIGGALASYRTLACASASSYWYSPYYWYGRRLLLSQGLSAAAGRSLLALPVCGAWDAATAMSLLAFVVYAVSCVLAGLDIKEGKGLVKPRGFDADASTLTVAVKAEKATLPITNPV